MFLEAAYIIHQLADRNIASRPKDMKSVRRTRLKINEI